MKLYQKGDIISDNIAFLGYYEWELSSIIKSISKNSAIMVDVGANMGYFSLLFLANSKNSILIAYEPSPNVFLLLKNNITINGFQNVALLNNYAVSNKSETLLFDNNNPNQSGWGHISVNFGIPVQAVSLDDEFYESNNVIDILKIDVEGFEFNVLNGAYKLLSMHRIKNIFFEINNEMLHFQSTTKDEIFIYLKKNGYSYRYINPELIHAFL
jgi:FkbM family methyltransferase